MNQNTPTPSSVNAATAACAENTPDATIELIANQLERAKDAAARIEKEGSVVRDSRGSVIPHPAIDIERAATKLAADLILKNQRKTKVEEVDLCGISLDDEELKVSLED